MLRTEWLLGVDVVAYWQYGMGGGWVRYGHSPQSSGRVARFCVTSFKADPDIRGNIIVSHSQIIQSQSWKKQKFERISKSES